MGEINSTFFHLCNETKGKFDILCGIVKTGALSQWPTPGCFPQPGTRVPSSVVGQLCSLLKPQGAWDTTTSNLASGVGGGGWDAPTPVGDRLEEPKATTSLEMIKRNFPSQENFKEQPDHHVP